MGLPKGQLLHSMVHFSFSAGGSTISALRLRFGENAVIGANIFETSPFSMKKNHPVRRDDLFV